MNNKLNQKDCMVAFIFDSGKFTTVFYGDKGVELILKEPGLSIIAGKCLKRIF